MLGETVSRILRPEVIQAAWENLAKVALSLLGEDGPLAGGRLMIVGEEADRDAAHSIRFAVKRERVIELQGRLTRLQTVAALSRAGLLYRRGFAVDPAGGRGGRAGGGGVRSSTRPCYHLITG